ncbi:MAG: hypothetical protein AAFS10_11685 [Myxococcota bacterium]
MNTSATPPSGSRTPVSGAVAIGVAVLVIGLLIYTLATGPGAGDAGIPQTDTPAAPSSSEEAPWRRYFNPKQVDFAPLTVPTEAIAKARATVPTDDAPPPSPQTLDTVLAHYFDLNRAEATGGDPTQRAIVAKRFHNAMRNLYADHGRNGINAIYDAIWPKFSQSLDAFAHPTTPLAKRLVNPPDDATRDAIRWAGGFVQLAIPTGLMSPTGTLAPEAKALLPVLLRYRLANALQGSIDPRELMTPPELRTIALWRLQTAPKLDPIQRQRAIVRVREYIPDYPAPIAVGVLYTKAERLTDAIGTFQSARLDHPELAPLLDVYIAQLETQLTTHDPSTP